MLAVLAFRLRHDLVVLRAVARPQQLPQQVVGREEDHDGGQQGQQHLVQLITGHAEMFARTVALSWCVMNVAMRKEECNASITFGRFRLMANAQALLVEKGMRTAA